MIFWSCWPLSLLGQSWIFLMPFCKPQLIMHLHKSQWNAGLVHAFASDVGQRRLDHMVFGHKGLPRKLPKANIARCWTWRSCDFTALSAAPLELCWEIEIPPRRYFHHLVRLHWIHPSKIKGVFGGCDHRNCRRRWNAAVGKRWASVASKGSRTIMIWLSISQIGNSPKWVLM